MQGLKAGKSIAQSVHELLKQEKLLAVGFNPLKEKNSIIFPLNKKISGKELKRFKGTKIVEKSFSKRKKRTTSLREEAKKFLSKKELNVLIASFDSYGNIAVIEIPKALKKKEKKIAESLLCVNSKFKTIAGISGKHETVFRVRPVKVIAGEKNLVADYRESGCCFRFELGKVFFSARLSNERLRISKLIKKGEVIGAFFAGVGPFPIVFAKNSPMKKAIAIELNPVGIEFLKQNISLNKCGEKIEVIQGDVKKAAKKFPQFFDRIVMPLPKGGENFLGEAIASVKRGGTIHFYKFAPKNSPYREVIELIKSMAKELGRKAMIKRKAKVRSFSPAVIQVVVDFKII